jgi:hypothetical protein
MILTDRGEKLENKGPNPRWGILRRFSTIFESTDRRLLQK